MADKEPTQDETFKLRISDALKFKIELATHKIGGSISSFMRTACEEKLERMNKPELNVDQQQAPVSNRYGRPNYSSANNKKPRPRESDLQQLLKDAYIQEQKVDDARQHQTFNDVRLTAEQLEHLSKNR